MIESLRPGGLSTAGLAALLLGGCVGDGTAPAVPAADAAGLTVRCGTLIDGLAEEPQSDKTIVVVGERIVAVVDGADYGEPTLDYSDRTCLPGLIDTHTHIAEPTETGDLASFYTLSEAENFAAARANAAAVLDSGFTTVRNVGTYFGWAARELRDRINAGELAGPRMQVAGYYLTVPGGGGDLVIPGYDESTIPAHLRMGVASGADEFRHKAEAAVAGGADFLKVIASGAVLAYGGVPGAPEMSVDEIRAVVEVAHAAGLRVTAHAHGAQSIKEAIAAGVDSIEHASLADEEAIALAVQHGVAFSMDVYNGDYIATVGAEEGWPAEFLQKNADTTEAQRQVFTRAHRAGVPILLGSDVGVFPPGLSARQFVIMVERGMTPMEAIKAATSVPARYMDWADDIGALVPGRFADLIVVSGDPLANIEVLQQVDHVIKGGRLIR